jgi:hypothetical protein
MGRPKTGSSHVSASTDKGAGPGQKGDKPIAPIGKKHARAGRIRRAPKPTENSNPASPVNSDEGLDSRFLHDVMTGKR